MPIVLKILSAAAAAALLAACAAPATFVADGQPVDLHAGYALIHASFTVSSQKDTRTGADGSVVDLTLQRLEADMSTHATKLEVARGRTVVIRLEPGVYYVSDAEAPSDARAGIHLQLPPPLTIFEVKAGQMNYPGDWRFGWKVAPGQEDNNWIEARHTESVVDDPKTGARYERLYPALSQQLPLVHSRLTVPPAKS